jgi:hypothetical protein
MREWRITNLKESSSGNSQKKDGQFSITYNIEDRNTQD